MRKKEKKRRIGEKNWGSGSKRKRKRCRFGERKEVMEEETDGEKEEGVNSA